MFRPTLEALQKVRLARGDQIDLAALEKDWYLTEIFQILSKAELPHGAQLLFTGGTSLSKRGIIARFSEDADFLLVDTLGELATRGQRRTFRKRLSNTISASKQICKMVEATARDDGRQIIIEVVYPTALERGKTSQALRPHIRLELRYTTTPLPSDVVAVRSLVGELINSEPSVALPTVSPLIIAANKFVGLAWRVIKRERAGANAKHEDRNLVRHVHDLAALFPTIQANSQRFTSLVEDIILSDRPRYSNLEVSPEQLIAKGAELVTAETPYRVEYERFIAAMSFAPIDEVIGYEEAIAAYKEIVSLAGYSGR